MAGSEVHGDVMVGENSPQFLKQTCYISNGNVVWFVIQFLPSWYLTFFFCASLWISGEVRCLQKL